MSTKRTAPPKMKPASNEWTAAFLEAIEGKTGVEQRKMFGYPAAFVGGNMAAGLHGDGLVLRLGDEDREELLRLGGKPFAPMPGRVMSGFALAPDGFLRDAKALRSWLERAIAHAVAMPPKKKVGRKG